MLISIVLFIFYSTLTTFKYRLPSLAATCQFVTLSTSSASILTLFCHRVRDLLFLCVLLIGLSLRAWELYLRSCFLSAWTPEAAELNKLYSIQITNRYFIQSIEFSSNHFHLLGHIFVFTPSFRKMLAFLQIFLRKPTFHTHR